MTITDERRSQRAILLRQKDRKIKKFRNALVEITEIVLQYHRLNGDNGAANHCRNIALEALAGDDPKLTELELFVLKTVKESEYDVYPGYIANLLAERNGGQAHAASRRMFGYTAVAYRTLRKLTMLGKIRQKEHRSTGGYLSLTFKKK